MLRNAKQRRKRNFGGGAKKLREWDFLELQAYALVTLGIPHSVFRSLTPAQFFSAAHVATEREKAEDYRCGVVVTVMRQLMGDKKAEPFDYFPQHKAEKVGSAKRRRKEFQAQLLAAALKAKGG